ncbi:MAG TPA: DNA/RNA nuclease SfsA [Thermohalobaculum sp.]|nr:DNA/RNA nuclease SfsA [Thermohalobaculum sp.]
MQFAAPLVPGTLIRRYKRFLADVRLGSGREVTAHCANPGAMMGLAAPGLKVWLEPNADPRRKLRFAWRLVETPDGFVGIDTAVPNRVVGEALAAGRVAELSAYRTVRREVRYAGNSRVDFVLSGDGLPDAHVEVKNVHLMRTAGLAEFPDSVTARGARHLDALAGVAAAGGRAVLLYCVQRTDCTALALARDIDPRYAAAAARAAAAGVETLAYAAAVGRDGIALDRPLRMDN